MGPLILSYKGVNLMETKSLTIEKSQDNEDKSYSSYITESIKLLNTVVVFLEKCILSKNYKPSPLYSEVICLSPKGEEIIKRITHKMDSEKNNVISELKLASLLSSLELIDINRMDVYKFLNIVHEEVKTKKLLFPYVFGRELYDKFFMLFNNDDHLNYEDTLKLLENTPNGVYQVNNLISGPFGLLKSQEIRNYGPVRAIPIHHCSDTACQTLHVTELSTADSLIAIYIKEINKIIDETSINKQIIQSQPLKQTSIFDDNNLDDLPDLLGTFPVVELRILLAYLIDNNKGIRQHFPKDRDLKHYWQGNGEKIASNLQHAECLQLILLFKDLEIASSLERLIYENKIHIPPTEIRSPHFRRKRKRVFKLNIECSRYGLRCTIYDQNQTNVALIRLKNLITKLYSESNNMEKLEWKLRNINGNNIVEKIEKYLLSENPKEILMNLIFDNSDYVKKTFEYLKYGDFELPYPPIKEEFIINKILWKLGFNSMTFPDFLNIFWKRHGQFLNIINITDIVTENDREAIRSAGVNYFVSLEEILDYSLSFITWALLSDHFLDTNFVFNLEDARKFMVEKINSQKYLINDNEYLVLDSEGKNTLYPLIKGFEIVAQLCEKCLNERNTYRRPKSEYPFYHNKTEIYKFPFDYKVFLLNLNESEVKRLINILREITNMLERNNISNVRNRIKHNRPINEFPNKNELENTTKVIEQVIKLMESEGIIPQLFIYSGTEIDQFGRGVTKYRNYRNVILHVSNNSQFIRCGLPDYKNPQLILPNLSINKSIEKPRFFYQDKTAYSNFWKDYPKRKIQNEESYNIKEE
jgi:hypothetical protein